jgi:epoxyqueuosine reductase
MGQDLRMIDVENSLKSIGKNSGADLVGITSRRMLADAPPSADPRYLLKSANSVVSYAVALDRELADDFIRKKSWRPHCEDRKRVVRKLYEIGDRLVEWLKENGHEAVTVDINNNYRSEENAADVTEMTEFHPEFSHRYAALAAGIGRLGWSGNLLTREYGALVELGSVLTSAPLAADEPIPDEDHPCDKCKMCSLVCPVEMISKKDSTRVTVAGVTETIAQKRPNTCCWIGCTGYEGLSVSGKWSNWSPYRLGQALPAKKQALDALCIRLQKSDPQMQGTANAFSDYRQAVFDPDWFYYTICGFCRAVCSPSRNERLLNRKRIWNAGTAALKMDGAHVVADHSAHEISTPFGLRVVVPCEALSKQKPIQKKWPGQFPLDREVIRHLCRSAIVDEEDC